MKTLLFSILVLFLSAASVPACSPPDNYKDQIRANITASEAHADAIIYVFYTPQKAHIGASSDERCVVRCDFNPGTKKSGPPLMIVRAAFYFEDGKLVPVASLKDIHWMDGEPKRDSTDA